MAFELWIEVLLWRNFAGIVVLRSFTTQEGHILADCHVYVMQIELSGFRELFYLWKARADRVGVEPTVPMKVRSISSRVP